MSECSDIDIKLYIDDQFIKNIEKNEKRVDVLNAIKDCGTAEQNSTPGFKFTMDFSDYKDGKHLFNIKIVNKKTKEELLSETRNLNLLKEPTTMCIDLETEYDVSTSKFKIRGWVMSTCTDIKILGYIDNEHETIITRNEKRPDVLNAIKGYGTEIQNPIPGFNIETPVINVNAGDHILKIVVQNSSTNEKLSEQLYPVKVLYKKGIDVSQYQQDIDWAQVKKDGVNFAMIRAGYRGYGTNGTLVTDKKYYQNINGALNNGIQVGVYFFTEAINEQEAIEEANYVLNLVSGYNITYPIAIDTEEISGVNARANNLSKEERTSIIAAFCNRIKQAGYEPMIYANKWWINEQLDLSKLSNYSIWLAHYTGATQDDPFAKPSDYVGNYIMWQYTSTGTVAGIIGNTDMNVTIPKRSSMLKSSMKSTNDIVERIRVFY